MLTQLSALLLYCSRSRSKIQTFHLSDRSFASHPAPPSHCYDRFSFCVCGKVCVHTCRSMWKPGANVRSFLLSLPHFLEIRFLHEPAAPCSCRPIGQRVPGTVCVCSPRAERTLAAKTAFTWLLSIYPRPQTEQSTLHRLSHLLAPLALSPNTFKLKNWFSYGVSPRLDFIDSILTAFYKFLRFI